MVELKVTLGTKGQVVIPKILRDYYKIYPNQGAIIKSTNEGVLIMKNEDNIIEKLTEIAKEASKNRKGKPFIYKKEEFYEQYDKRAKRAGL